MRAIFRIFVFFLVQFIIAYICFAAYNQNLDISKWPTEIAHNFAITEGLVGVWIILIVMFIE